MAPAAQVNTVVNPMMTSMENVGFYPYPQGTGG